MLFNYMKKKKKNIKIYICEEKGEKKIYVKKNAF